MLLARVVDTSQRVRDASGRLDKVEILADCLRRAPPADLPVVVAYLSGSLRQGRPGVGPAAVKQALEQAPRPTATLRLRDVDDTLAALARTTGPGSTRRRAELLAGLFARATNAEQLFVAMLLFGELRQGASEGVMAEAIARAAGVGIDQVRRAWMLSGDLGAVAQAALTAGAPGLSRFSLQVLHPVQPMLAQPAETVEAALAALGRAALELKMDGARVQVHRAADEVRVYSRRLNDVTGAVPEVVEAVRALPLREVILDGEVLALRPDGTPQPFQTTMLRFGRRLKVERARAELPLSTFYFDCLYLDGQSLIERPTAVRYEALGEAAPPQLRMPRIVTASPAEAGDFFAEALARGHEGVLAKSLSAPYESGRRGGAWLKLKSAHSLDLVVIAAEWGHGRRHGWLSNLHLAAREPGGGLVMLGKTFKGLTDELLRWQTDRLLELETHRDATTVHVRPRLVAEVAFGDVQASPQYPAGVALRFARLLRYRPDKSPEQASTIEEVERLLSRPAM